jgi:hypothetical protein
MDQGQEICAVPTRRPYEAPALIRRDSLAAVTAVLKKVSGEDDKPKAPCWVARAAYGEDNPRWLFFRAWLLEDAPLWLRRAYLRHGPAFAPIVARRRWLAGALRALMDRAIAAKFPAR